MSKIVGKIVLTGGPCAGKTSALKEIDKHFTKLGYKVIIVPEAASMLINGGIKCFGENCLSLYEFQNIILNLQLQNERLYEQAALSYSNDTKCIMIYDRGFMDNNAYIDTKSFDRVLLENNMSKLDLIDHYDMVLHLVTAALGAEKFYTLENNGARIETIEEARDLDKRTMDAWRNNSNLYIIGNETDFKSKIDRVISHIEQLIINPYRVKRRKRYLVDLTSINTDFFSKCLPIRIEQSYLESSSDYEKRLRKRILGNYSTYSLTIQKQNIDSSDIYIDKRISSGNYYDLLKEEKSSIEKTRYSFINNNIKYNLDIYDNDLCILESTSNELYLDNNIRIIDEITNNSEYSNYSMSLNKVLSKKI